MGRLTDARAFGKGHGASTSETAGKESDATPSLYLTNEWRRPPQLDAQRYVRGASRLSDSLATWFCPAFVHDSQIEGRLKMTDRIKSLLLMLCRRWLRIAIGAPAVESASPPLPKPIVGFTPRISDSVPRSDPPAAGAAPEASS